MEDEKLQKLADLIAKQMDLKNSMSHNFIKEALEAIFTFDEEHTEKGLSGYGDFGPVGVAVKLSEKYNILKEHYTVGGDKLTSEEIESLWKDVSVYALMGKLVESGDWK